MEYLLKGVEHCVSILVVLETDFHISAISVLLQCFTACIESLTYTPKLTRSFLRPVKCTAMLCILEYWWESGINDLCTTSATSTTNVITVYQNFTEIFKCFVIAETFRFRECRPPLVSISNYHQITLIKIISDGLLGETGDLFIFIMSVYVVNM